MELEPTAADNGPSPEIIQSATDEKAELHESSDPRRNIPEYDLSLDKSDPYLYSNLDKSSMLASGGSVEAFEAISKRSISGPITHVSDHPDQRQAALQTSNDAMIATLDGILVCGVCKKPFRGKSGLNHHELKHNKEKSHRHRCSGCNIGFRYPKDLLRHQVAKHSTRTYECKNCGKSYSRADHLERHLRSKSHRAREDCLAEQDKGFSADDYLRDARQKEATLTVPRGGTPVQAVQDLTISDKSRADGSAEISPTATTSIGGASLEDNVVIPEDSQDDCDSDDAASIFSQESIASTATSLAADNVSVARLDLISSIAISLSCSAELQQFHLAAIEDLEIGPERLRRNIRRMIKTFGKDLRCESKSPFERSIAIAMQTRRVSTHASLEIMSAIRALRPTEQPTAKHSMPTNTVATDEEAQSDDSIDSASENEAEEDSGTDGTETIAKSFLLGSRAYAMFTQHLIDFAHKPYQRRLAIALGDMVLGNRGTRLSRPAVALLTNELSWVSPQLFLVEDSFQASALDSVKLLVEQQLGETWDWWPLTQTYHSLTDGYCRLQWTTPAGIARYIDFPQHVRVKFEEAIATAPVFVDLTDSGTMWVCSPGHTSTPRPNGRASPSPAHPSATINLQSLPTNGTQQHSQRGDGSGIGAVSRGGNKSSRTIAQSLSNALHVYLCVTKGSNYRFSDLTCAVAQTDLAFFAALRVQYLDDRGWLRYLFSMWRYDHCDFYRMHKHGVHLGSPLSVGFPPESDQLYDFSPRPPLPGPPDGPITEAEFRDHFYNSQARHHTWARAQKCRFFGTDCSAVQSLPKRKQALALADAKREYFYGLYARERRCFGWVAGYFFACQVPSIIFFFLWLFEWKHAADLQGASVPASLTIGLSCCWLAYIIDSREKS